MEEEEKVEVEEKKLAEEESKELSSLELTKQLRSERYLVPFPDKDPGE